ncbi:MAG: arginine--tRNA ligase, partial [Candidatus Shapirobacteria bacterium]|nr:arginine--tRNA ligase [Candidatus Shapirobacteria bacterium]
MKIVEDLKQIIFESIKKIDLSIKKEKIKIEHPSEVNFGDYSTNIAMVLANLNKKNPREIANLVCQSINLSENQLIKNIEVAGAGFINFY